MRSPTLAVPRTLMITVAWGNFLSIVLPGVLVLFAIRRFSPALDGIVGQPATINTQTGVFLLIVATLAGGVVDGMRRVAFEAIPMWWRRAHAPSTVDERPNRYASLTPSNQGLFDMLVEQSWRYYTFYGNLFWAVAILLGARLTACTWNSLDLVLLGAAATTAMAARAQYEMFGDAMSGFMESEAQRRKERRDAEKPPPC